MRRAVITGIGSVNPLGATAEQSWQNLIAGQSAARKITKFDTSDLPSRIACEVPRGEGGFVADDWVSPKEQRRMDEFILLGMVAADMAIEDSGYKAETDEQKCRTGVAIGSGIGGLPSIEQNTMVLYGEGGARKVSPFFIPGALINLVSGQVSIRHGFKGPNHSVVTACATGAHAIGDAAHMVIRDDADVMIAGGSESVINRLCVAGFSACRALSTNFNDTPEKASRPYDKDRDGFVVGEGAGIVVIEEYEHAKARGAKIYAEIAGYGMSGDAHHITSPAEDGNGGERAMRAALKHGRLNAEDIGYINAHGTSTPLGDEIELKAVERLFGVQCDGLAMSSTKSAIGHLLGAAGAVEAVFSLLVLRDGILPPTLNLDNPSVETAIDLIPHKAKEKKISAVLSNSFGFGGTNASLLFKAIA